MTLDSTQENQPAHTSTPEGQQPAKGRKPTRAERKEANRLARAKADLEAQAHADNPLRTAAAAAGAGQEKWPAPSASPEGQLIPQEERRQQMQEERRQEKEKGTGGQLSVGRPSEYTVEEGDTLCAWVQAGGSLRGYCKETGRSAATVYRWMREDTQFQARYSQAHEDRADTLTDEMLEIADTVASNPSIEAVAAAKLQVEARKWIASKLRPQRWGDKQIVEHKGNVSIRIGIPQKPLATALPPASDGDIIDV